jgi:predicted transcriptional regulator
MHVFLTNHTKLALAAGVSNQHISQVKRGAWGMSAALAEKLEMLTRHQVKRELWVSASTKKTALNNALKKFFKEEKERENLALKRISH